MDVAYPLCITSFMSTCQDEFSQTEKKIISSYHQDYLMNILRKNSTTSSPSSKTTTMINDSNLNHNDRQSDEINNKNVDDDDDEFMNRMMNDEESPSPSSSSIHQTLENRPHYAMYHSGSGQQQQQQQQSSGKSMNLAGTSQQQLFAQLAHQYSAMHLQWLSNSSVTCNDGTRAGYYIRPSPTGSRRWIIFLEGGWYCMSKSACDQRWYKMRDFMTSFRWSQYKTGKLFFPVSFQLVIIWSILVCVSTLFYELQSF